MAGTAVVAAVVTGGESESDFVETQISTAGKRIENLVGNLTKGKHGDRRAVSSYFVREMARLARNVVASVPHHVPSNISIAILVPICYRYSSSVRASVPEGASVARLPLLLFDN